MKYLSRIAMVIVGAAVLLLLGGYFSGGPPVQRGMSRMTREIEQDLGLPEHSMRVLEATSTILDGPEARNRDEALVLSQDDDGYTLRYVCRFPQDEHEHLREWSVWVNYEIIGDGTGAEVHAIKHFADRPSDEEIAEFRQDTVEHWSHQ